VWPAEREDLPDDAVRDGKIGRGEVRDRGLAVARHGVVDAGGDAPLLEELRELVAARGAHDVEVVHVPAARPLGGETEIHTVEAGRVARGEAPAVVVHGIQAAQEHAAHRGLDVIEAKIEANLGMHVLVEPAVVADPAAPNRHGVVIGHDHAAVAHHVEILRRIEGKGARATEAADLLVLPLGAVSLRAIFEQPEPVRLAQRLDAGEIRGLPVEVHGHEAHRARRDPGGGVPNVHGVAVVDVDEDRRGAGEADRLDGGERRVRGHEHLVARSRPERLHQHPDRRRRARGQDGVLGAVVRRELVLERAAFGTQDVLAGIDRLQHGPLDLVVDGGTGERNRHQRDPPGVCKRL
jgi:hypothetical protein